MKKLLSMLLCAVMTVTSSALFRHMQRAAIHACVSV